MDLPTQASNKHHTLLLEIISRLCLLVFLSLPLSSIATDPPYVNSQTCATCHPREFKDWQQSHHAAAMQPANKQTVLGDFNNAVFNYYGITTRFYQQDGHFYIHTQGTDGNYGDFKVLYTFGVEPLQQYLVSFSDGRLQAFTIAWDTHQKKWFSLYPHENITPHDPLHWTGRVYTWNHFCADCHSTNLQKNYEITTATYHTNWSAINVDCQACHGPAAGHVKWAQIAKSDKAIRDPQQGFVFNQQTLTSPQLIEGCAFCHARRHPISPQIQTGTPFLDNYMPEILRKDVYYADGGLQEEDYEYGSFTQSKMYQSGVMCTDCHNPHSLQLKAQGNGLCLQCHNPNPPVNRFSNLLAKDYATPDHHFHKTDSPGARCISCHMPPKTYMQVDVRRDHYFRIPRPDLTIKYGIPNACNICHTDKSAQWSEDYIEKWYGKKTYPDDYTEILIRGRARDPGAEADLITLAQNPKRSAIVRATALELLQPYQSTTATDTFIAATKDKDPLVRTLAAKSLVIASANQRLTALAPLLDDPIRAVRIQAARALVNTPSGDFDAAHLGLFNKALAEYRAAQQAQIDQPEANLNLGVLAWQQQNKESAAQYYQSALQMDKSFYPASQNLAILYNSIGQNSQAEQVLRDAISYNQQQGELYYSLGLLFAEQGDFTAAAATLAQAAKLMPDNARVYFNYGLALIKAGNVEQAKTLLLKAHDLAPEDERIREALVVLN